jgi:hypothetical protein
MKEKILLILSVAILSGADFDYNASIVASYGDNYDFYSYSENRLDLNIFYNDIQAWVQYEYSNPPEVGFPLNDIRKFRVEYARDNFTLKVGDIYEYWGRGLVFNQIDDQTTNYDNGTRGLFFGYTNGGLSLSHLNGNSEIWYFGMDLREPYYNNSHSMYGNQAQYDWNKFSIGLTQLHSNETHQKYYGEAYVNHNLKGIYGSIMLNNADLFVEYVDKKSTENVSQGTPHDTLINGYGVYGNLNLYLGSWGLTTEYKRYVFDRGHGDFTADEYGNRIGFQMMPTLGREQNTTLLGRVVHPYNYNDERGIQLSLTGPLPLGLNLLTQYAHLSRNDTWQSYPVIIDTNNYFYVWNNNHIDGFLPGSNESSLPYWENYQEISGFALDDNLYFRFGRGNNKEVSSTTRYFEGEEVSITENWVYTDSIEWNNGWFYTDSVLGSIDTSNYSIEAKMWQEVGSITYPFELSYTLNNGYSFKIGFEYQERKKRNVSRGNASSIFNWSDSSWTLVNPDNPDSFFVNYDNQFTDWNSVTVKTQFNRMVTLSFSKASKWSLTINHDQSSAFDGPKTIDPYYNPLEALIFGDIKYFTGKRDRSAPPRFGQQRWVSAELALNLTASQRLSIMYGSIQGGLYCSNGICRQIAPFNDGVKLSYSAIF